MDTQTEPLPTLLQVARHLRHQADLMGDWDSMRRAELAPEDVLTPKQVAAAYRIIADTFDPPTSDGTGLDADSVQDAEEHASRFSPLSFLERLAARRAASAAIQGAEGAEGAASAKSQRHEPPKPRAGR